MSSEEKQIILVFDVGTQSSRAMLVDSHGSVLGISKQAHEPAYTSLHADWAEQDADFYYETICRAAKQLREEKKDLWKDIKAVSVTTIRDTIVCVDKDGKPLRPAILWLDKRRADGKADIPFFSRLLLKAVGMENTINTQFQKSHCNWIRTREPEIWEKTYKLLFISGYLIFKLTGNMKDAAASLVGHLPINSKTRSWQGPNALTSPVFPVDQDKLCEIADSGDILGYITPQMAADSDVPQGLPVIATGSDKACEILGLGCVTKEKAAIGFGTTATITFMNNTYLEPERFIPPYPAVIKGSYNPEIEIFRGYWLVSWFKKEFASKEVEQAQELGISVEDLLDQHLKDIPPGCEGLLFQPYLTPNVTMPTARGAVIGFADLHTRIHLYRAIIEGINFALYDGMKLMEHRARHKFQEIYLGGGGSQSDEICQITADMFGIPVVRTQTFEVTGIGCALAAFVGIGTFKSYEEAVQEMVHEKDRFIPDMEIHKKYEELYDGVFKKIYHQLSPLYNKLHEIYHRD